MSEEQKHELVQAMEQVVDHIDEKIILEQLNDRTSKPMSEVATEFAQEINAKSDEELKAHNLPEDQQMEFQARFFQMYFKVFQNKINKMPKKAAARVITRLIAYPIETDNLTWLSSDEKDTFLIGNQLLETKYLMFKYMLKNEIEKAKLEEETRKSIEGEENGPKT